MLSICSFCTCLINRRFDNNRIILAPLQAIPYFHKRIYERATMLIILFLAFKRREELDVITEYLIIHHVLRVTAFLFSDQQIGIHQLFHVV